MNRFPLKPQPILIPEFSVDRSTPDLSNKNNLTWDDIEIPSLSFLPFLQKIYIFIKRICKK